MPVAAQVDVTTSDDDLKVRVVTDAPRISKDVHLDVQRFPNAVVDDTRRNVSEVLLLADGVAARRDQLKVVSMNALGHPDVYVDKRLQTTLLDLNEFGLWIQRHDAGD
jgi:hypothetical protein